MEKYKSLLETTLNTRELGGYLAESGTLTREKVLIRSDVPTSPSEKDFKFLLDNGITTIIDLRGANDVERKPNGFANKEGFSYFNFQIDEGSGIPESVDEVPHSYMRIAAAKVIGEVFSCIANSDTGVMFNCTAGKDRTGVISAILLLHSGVSDKNIIENYVLTKEYSREMLESVRINCPEIDIRIVTPCEMYMEEFLRMFREKYVNTDGYFEAIGLSSEEIDKLRHKLV